MGGGPGGCCGSLAERRGDPEGPLVRLEAWQLESRGACQQVSHLGLWHEPELRFSVPPCWITEADQVLSMPFAESSTVERLGLTSILGIHIYIYIYNIYTYIYIYIYI